MTDHLMSSDPTWWRRSRLAEPRSIIGALGIIAVVALFVLGVPFAEDNVEQRGGLDDAGRFIVDDYTAMTLADGWSVDTQSDLFTTLTDGTYTIILPPSVEDPATPEESLSPFRDSYLADPANTVTDIVSFTTDDGAPAAEYRAILASDPTGNGNAFAAVAQNGRTFSPATTGPPDLDDPFYDDFLTMVRSIVITAEPREGSS